MESAEPTLAPARHQRRPGHFHVEGKNMITDQDMFKELSNLSAEITCKKNRLYSPSQGKCFLIPTVGQTFSQQPAPEERRRKQCYLQLPQSLASHHFSAD
jgi:hypothetical protein